jgi:prevent-host-death family protein
MSKTWQLQEAKAKFSSLVKAAQEDGPQFVTKHGEPTVVVVSVETFNQLKPKSSIVNFFRESPFFEEDLEIERNKDLGRDVEL